MKCEICSNHEATVRIKQVLDGDAKEMFVCESCASKSGLDPDSPLALTDFLFGAGMQESYEGMTSDAVCPECNMHKKDFKKKTLLGCASCYNTFADELKSYIESMHKDVRHVGKVPVKEQQTEETASLERALKKAIEAQDFEEAATLRDRLNDIKGNRGAIF